MQGGVKQKLLFSWYIRAIWRGRPVGPAGRPATLGRGRGRSVGLVVLERLREPRLDLANAGRIRRVSREEFRLSRTAARPRYDGRAWADSTRRARSSR